MSRNIALLRAGLGILGIGILVFSLRGELIRLPQPQWMSVLTSLLLTLTAFCCYAGRFRTVMQMVTLRLSPLQALRLTASASFYQSFLPLSIGGDLTRFALCAAAAPLLPRRRIASGIVLDHLVGSLALVMLAIPWALRILPAAEPWAGGLALLAVGLPLLLMFSLRSLRARMRRMLRTMRMHLPAALVAILLSLAMQLLLAIAVWNLARMWQMEIAFVDLLGVVACGALLQVIPVNLGGLHLGDVAGGALYMLHGLSFPQAALLATSLYCLRALVAMLGGVWDLAQARRATTSTGINP